MAIISRPASSRLGFLASVYAQSFALLSAVFVLVWVIHYEGGLALHSHNKARIFNVHPVAMVLGYIIVMGEAIMVYRIVPAASNVKKLIHMMLQFVGLVLGTFGVYAAFKFHKESQIPDLYTWHSWLGLASICLSGCQWVSGFLFFLYPRAAAPTREKIAPMHAVAGLTVFLLSICAALTGFMQKGGSPGEATLILNFSALAVLLYAVGVGFSTALQRVLTI